ncbi:hypothetical protein CRG98_016509 [Punica granatum]|uniref:NB-ARC domain-containing protein n=1 Tax=Punica granatum TaxID=22663 RepID=A0A2I0K3H8_PUNGR|nr:hypothetical protein CRG98_016509 [Punica granatum]
MVKCCNGLPLALKVLGRSMYRQPLPLWMEKVRKLLSGVTTFDSELGIPSCPVMSLDILDDEDPVKKCFLELGSFREDQKIPVNTLLDMWEELYDLNGDGVSAMANIDSLCELNLARFTPLRRKANEVDNRFGGQFVPQHGLLRDLAIYRGMHEAVDLTERLIVSIFDGNFLDWWKEHKLHPARAQLLSITTDETFSADWLNLEASVTDVLVLNFLSENYMLLGFIRFLSQQTMASSQLH